MYCKLYGISGNYKQGGNINVSAETFSDILDY